MSKSPVFGKKFDDQLSATDRYVFVGNFVMFLGLFHECSITLKCHKGCIFHVFAVAPIGQISPNLAKIKY